MTSFDGKRGGASWRQVTALAASAFLAAAVAGADAKRGADDAAIKRKVEERLARDKAYAEADVRVSVERGVVVLEGATARMDAALRAERAALKEAKRVDNRLKVLPAVERKDSELRKDVADAVLRYPFYTVFDSIEAGVADGVVTLRGSVNQPWRKTEIENRVARVEGLRGMVSEIAVQSVSPFDDRLRRELVQRIYGDERFYPYAHWAHPPIRIVVDRGRVTLTGYVGSAVEQQLLGHIARGTLAFAVDNQVKLESDQPAEPKAKSTRDS